MGRSDYYHAFQIDIWGNRWPWFAMGALAVMFIVGWMSCVEGRARIRRRYGDVFTNALAALAGCLFAILVALDSGLGILQLCDNTLLTAGDDPTWSLFFTAIAIAVSGFVAWFVFDVAVWAGVCLKTRRLRATMSKKPAAICAAVEAEMAATVATTAEQVTGAVALGKNAAATTETLTVLSGIDDVAEHEAEDPWDGKPVELDLTKADFLIKIGA